MDELLLYDHFKDLRLIYPNLSLHNDGEGPWYIKGTLNFSRDHSGIQIEDEFSVEIIIPETYPVEHPRIRETENRIPENFHHYIDNSLCLGAPLAIKRNYKKYPTLVGYVNNCVVPYLYSFSYKSKYGKMPFGELTHGGLGILEFYQDLFNLKGHRAPLELIEILAKDHYRGHIRCPCGNGKRLRDCHGGLLLEIKELQPVSDFQKEYDYISQALTESTDTSKFS